DGEPVRSGADVLHQRDVLLVAVVVVVGDVAIVVVLDVPRRMRIRIPDREALAVLIPRTFDLIRRGGDAPVKALGELPRRAGLFLGLWCGHLDTSDGGGATATLHELTQQHRSERFKNVSRASAVISVFYSPGAASSRRSLGVVLDRRVQLL